MILQLFWSTLHILKYSGPFVDWNILFQLWIPSCSQPGTSGQLGTSSPTSVQVMVKGKDPDPEPDLIPLTNGSESGSGRSENMQIRIPNTALNIFFVLVSFTKLQASERNNTVQSFKSSSKVLHFFFRIWTWSWTFGPRPWSVYSDNTSYHNWDP